MKKILIKPLKKIKKITINNLPGDKSISHRAIIFSSVSSGKCILENISQSEDVKNTLKIFSRLSVKSENSGRNLIVYGKGKKGLKESDTELYCGNSGTTMRLMTGILSAQNFSSVLTGDESLSKRPMKRIIEPLNRFGADIYNSEYSPVKIMPNRINENIYFLPSVASAQVKSAVLLRGIYADNTFIKEIYQTRNHTEIFFKNTGSDIKVKGTEIYLKKPDEINCFNMFIPGDISSAAYFIAIGLIYCPVTVKNVCLNKTRTGFIDILKKMGADIEIKNISQEFEIYGDITAYPSELKGIKINGDIIPNIIDEIPIIALIASFASGETEISGAGELRIKESDRIKTVCCELKKIGINTEEKSDGMIIKKSEISKEKVLTESHNDHRIALMLSVAAMLSESGYEIKNTECINTSFPEFFDFLNEYTL